MEQVCLAFFTINSKIYFDFCLIFYLGYCFIKRIKEGSVVDRLKTLVKLGDHIEKINDKSLIGARHFEVAKMLKDIPVGTTFKMRLVEPNAFGFRTSILFFLIQKK
jgi:hypothetical protein